MNRTELTAAQTAHLANVIVSDGMRSARLYFANWARPTHFSAGADKRSNTEIHYAISLLSDDDAAALAGLVKRAA